MLTFALPTGRSLDDAIELLGGAGLPIEQLKQPGRNLVFHEGDFRYILTKPTDIPAMVHYGVADLALGGSDVIEEEEIPVAELLDTGRAGCCMAVAGPAEMAEKFSGDVCRLMGLRVATKYTKTAKKTFEAWGIQIKILKLNGSVEIGPALNLSDCIFDIVQTGNTLRANGLVVIKKAAPVSLRLIAGTGAMRMHWEKIEPVVESIKKYVKENPR